MATQQILEDDPIARTLIQDILEKLRRLEEHLDQRAADEARADGDRLLVVEEAAKRLRLSVQTVYRRYREGKFHFIFRDGGRLVASERELNRWIAAGRRN